MVSILGRCISASDDFQLLTVSDKIMFIRIRFKGDSMTSKIKGYIEDAVQVFKIKFANNENADIAKFVKVYVMVSLNQNDNMSFDEAEKLYEKNKLDVYELKQMQHHSL